MHLRDQMTRIIRRGAPTHTLEDQPTWPDWQFAASYGHRAFTDDLALFARKLAGVLVGQVTTAP
jgi:hypothetical protein